MRTPLPERKIREFSKAKQSENKQAKAKQSEKISEQPCRIWVLCIEGMNGKDL